MGTGGDTGTSAQGKPLPRRLQHSFQGRRRRVPGGLGHFDPDLSFGDGELQFVAEVGDAGDFHPVDVIGNGRVKAEAGLRDPGKVGAGQRWGQRVAPKQSSSVGSAQPRPPQRPLPLLRASVGRKSPWCLPRISRQILNTPMKHLLRSYSGCDFTAQRSCSPSSSSAGLCRFH